MTTMKRMTIFLSPKQDTVILELRKTDQYCRMSYSKIIRLLLDAGIERIETGLIPFGTAKDTGGRKMKKRARRGDGRACCGHSDGI